MRFIILQENIAVQITWLNNIENYQGENDIIPSLTGRVGDTWDGVNFISPSKKVRQVPNWALFNKSCLESNTVKTILVSTLDKYAVDNLRSLISPAAYSRGLGEEYYPVLVSIWNHIIDGINNPLDLNSNLDLNTISDVSNVPVTFQEDCRMLLN